MPIKGKQVVDNTITQPKLNLSYPTLPQDAATKQYVDENQSVETNSTSNKTMTASATVADGDAAVLTPLTDQPVSGSGVSVVVNGIKVPAGNTADDVCYFSPDGIYHRAFGNERQGDVLYWIGSLANFQLDVADTVDYNYIISNQDDRVVVLQDGDVFTHVNASRQNLFTFDGVDGDIASVIIDGISFDVGNVSDEFVFDIGNVNAYEHTFTVVGEQWPIIVLGIDYIIVWDGTGSLLFTVNEELVEVDTLEGGNANDTSQSETPISGGASNPASQTDDPVDGGTAN